MDNRANGNKIDSAVAALAPWIFQFRVGEGIYGGSLDPSQDTRITHVFSFAPHAQTILEPGRSKVRIPFV